MEAQRPQPPLCSRCATSGRPVDRRLPASPSIPACGRPPVAPRCPIRGPTGAGAAETAAVGPPRRRWRRPGGRPGRLPMALSGLRRLLNVEGYPCRRWMRWAHRRAGRGAVASAVRSGRTMSIPPPITPAQPTGGGRRTSASGAAARSSTRCAVAPFPRTAWTCSPSDSAASRRPSTDGAADVAGRRVDVQGGARRVRRRQDVLLPMAASSGPAGPDSPRPRCRSARPRHRCTGWRRSTGGSPRTSTTAQFPPSALRDVIDGWLFTLESDVIAAGVDPADEAALDREVAALLETRLAAVARTAPRSRPHCAGTVRPP